MLSVRTTGAVTASSLRHQLGRKSNIASTHPKGPHLRIGGSTAANQDLFRLHCALFLQKRTNQEQSNDEQR